MQSVDNNGIFGEVQQFDEEGLTKMINNPNIDRVEVFEGTKRNIKRRKKMVGKKYSLKPAYQKAPKINSKSKKKS